MYQVLVNGSFIAEPLRRMSAGPVEQVGMPLRAQSHHLEAGLSKAVHLKTEWQTVPLGDDGVQGGRKTRSGTPLVSEP